MTQFEALTAAAFDELARREVEVAVVEAGLGGRHDATGVLRAPIVVLTNVGLEHTRWLGPTIADIAREKLAVVGPDADARARRDRPRSVEALARADRRAASCGAERGARARALPGYQRHNFARRAAPPRARSSARSTTRSSRRSPRASACPGGLQIVGERPLTMLDGAHNPSGVEALAAALPRARRSSRVVSILDDKDAAAMLRALLPRCATFVCTARRTRARCRPRRWPRSRRSSARPREIVPEPRAALARARELAGPGRRRRRHRLDLPDRGPASRAPGAPGGPRAL